jgi:hypothetical protein
MKWGLLIVEKGHVELIQYTEAQIGVEYIYSDLINHFGTSVENGCSYLYLEKIPIRFPTL